MIFSSIAMLVSSIGITVNYSSLPSSDYSMAFTTLNHTLTKCHLDLTNISPTPYLYDIGGSYSYQEGSSTITTRVDIIEMEFFTSNNNNTLNIRYHFGGTFSNLSYVFTCSVYGDDNTITGFESNPVYEYTQNDLEDDMYTLSIDISNVDFRFDDYHSGIIFDFYISLMDSTYYQNHFSEESLNQYYVGYEDGRNEGIEIGKDEGYQNGYDDGHRDGFMEGIDSGEAYNTGYADGFNNGQAASSQDFGLMKLFTGIADTPIMMMRSLFGFEIFGTSVLAVVLSLFTALIIIHIFKKVIK